MRILIIGGTGFIGRHLIARLSGGLHQMIVPTRLLARGSELQVFPTVTLVQTDIHDDAALDGLVRGCDVVVNLVGILHGNIGKPYGSDFARAHVPAAPAHSAGLPAPGRASPSACQRAGRRLPGRQHVPALQGRRRGRDQA